MKYISGVQALNIPCELNTCGDWHSSSMNWNDLDIRNSEESVFGCWGIEGPKYISEKKEKYYVANDIRACLDLIEAGQFSLAQGMREDFICNDSYTDLIMEKVFLLRNDPAWDKIDEFMRKEYYMRWVRYCDEHNR